MGAIVWVWAIIFPMGNDYSRLWFELFLQTRPYTQQEIDFIVEQFPNPPYRRVLDLCCGEGRHANILAEIGYQMVGVDLDGAALAIAESKSNGLVTYIEKDMREIAKLPGQFDAILSMWQSFGYFDEVTNRDILRQISGKLRPGGRFILDIYNRVYWAAHGGKREFEKKGVRVTVENQLTGSRLRSSLSYGRGLGGDVFEWETFTLDEIKTLAWGCGLAMILSCTECDGGSRCLTKSR